MLSTLLLMLAFTLGGYQSKRTADYSQPETTVVKDGEFGDCEQEPDLKRTGEF